ncbi:MAG: hypothetical protein H7Z14_05850 [Anaerolineae bacterium]|nr:hypothetical protein [Phycisphaerae bacterium]
MATKRIGEILSQMVPLSLHDIEEILQEQNASNTKKSFGDIALSMGLCRPEHVWRAWCGQLVDGPPRKIDLDRAGVDTQALSCISPELAQELHVIPVRVLGNILIVAISADAIGLAATQLPSRVNKELRFAIADRSAIHRALAKYYPALQEVN